MNILTVIPLAKGIPRDELSYFSARDVTVGTMVTVPFGGRKIRAVVVDFHSVRDLKAGIKGASFQLKNIIEIHPESLPAPVFAAAQSTARFFAQSVGAVITTMVPKPLFEYYLTQPTQNTSATESSIATDIQIIQVPHTERISIYKTLIRENFAKQQSTMIVAPTIVQVEQLFATMKTGIDDRIVMLHGKISAKKITAAVAQSITAQHPIVIIATPSYASIMRTDYNSIIIESSSSPYYRYDFGPRFDMRHHVESVARGLHTERLIYADTFIGTDLRARAAKKHITDVRSTWHITRPEQFAVIDMRPAESKPAQTYRIPAPSAGPSSKIIHPDTQAMIAHALAQKSRIVLLSNRKGLAPLTVCSDCGTAVTCPNCETPLVLHRKKTNTSARHPGVGRDPEITRTYVCHHCLQTTQPIDHCAHCFGSRLAMLGISTERILDEVTELFPDAPVVVSGDDEQTIGKTMKSWDALPSGILIATHTVLPYLSGVPYGAIISFDSLLSLPAYTSAETGVITMLHFLELITDGAIVQTRTRGHDAIRAIESENLIDFMRGELDARAQFHYPPTTVLVKISLDAKKTELKSVTDYFETIFKPYDPDILMKKSLRPNQVIIQAIMKIDPAIWNDPESPIQSIMRELPREFVRDINPDSVV